MDNANATWYVKIIRFECQPYSETLKPAQNEASARAIERHWWGQLRGEPCMVELWRDAERVSNRSTLAQCDLDWDEFGYGAIARHLDCKRRPLVLSKVTEQRDGPRSIVHHEYSSATGEVVGRIQFRSGNGRSDETTYLYANFAEPVQRAVNGAALDWLLCEHEDRCEARPSMTSALSSVTTLTCGQ